MTMTRGKCAREVAFTGLLGLTQFGVAFGLAWAALRHRPDAAAWAVGGAVFVSAGLSGCLWVAIAASYVHEFRSGRPPAGPPATLLVLELSPAVATRIERLRVIAECRDEVAVLTKALAVYDVLARAVADGGEVVIEGPDGAASRLDVGVK